MYNSIKPGKKWLDTDGKPIQAHGFSVFYNNGTYYWYGENKEKTDGKGNIWHWGVRCYTSNDLYNWEDRGLIITPDIDDLGSPLHPTYNMDRPHIIYCAKTKKYVAWIKIMCGITNQFMSVLQSDNFLGPYTFVHKIYNPLDMDTGDFTLCVDEKTKNAYLIFDRPHFEIITATLSEDYTQVTGEYSVHYENLKPPYAREAPVHFERKGKHYLFTSGTTGYHPNKSNVAMFEEYHGRYINCGNPHVGDITNTSFNSQITCVLKVPHKDLYIAMADRWLPSKFTVFSSKFVALYMKRIFKNYVPDRNEKREGRLSGKLLRHKENTSISDYVWLPIEWKNDKPIIQWHREWRIEDYSDID